MNAGLEYKNDPEQLYQIYKETEKRINCYNHSEKMIEYMKSSKSPVSKLLNSKLNNPNSQISIFPTSGRFFINS